MFNTPNDPWFISWRYKRYQILENNHDTMKTAIYQCQFVCISRNSSCLNNFYPAKWVWGPWSSCPPFLRKEFLLFSVCTISRTLRPSSRSRHEHKHSTKYNLGQRTVFPVAGGPLGKPVHLFSKLVFLLVNHRAGGMASKLMDSPVGPKSSVYPLARRVDTGNISHTALSACLRAFSEGQKDEVHPSLNDSSSPNSVILHSSTRLFFSGSRQISIFPQNFGLYFLLPSDTDSHSTMH